MASEALKNVKHISKTTSENIMDIYTPMAHIYALHTENHERRQAIACRRVSAGRGSLKATKATPTPYQGRVNALLSYNFFRRLATVVALVVMTLAPSFVNAQSELTVYDGTTTNSYVPAYMGYFDDYSRSQFVIPASALTSMAGGTISSIKFYTNSSNVPYTSVSTVDVYLKEVGNTTISAFETKASSTVVYTGALAVVTAGSGGELTINFNTPYTYDGGNLMIGIENTTDAGYKFIYFYGQTVNGASVAGYNGTSLNNVTATQQNFIPKTTFYYTPSCQPTWTGTSNYYINNFTVTKSGTTLLNSSSTGTTRTTTDYYDSRSIEATAGDVLTCVTTMSTSTTYGFALWIDFNHNGLDAGDLQFSTSSYQSSPYTISFTIPSSTPAGEYRLRIWGDCFRGSASDPCGSYSTGEAEDYMLIVSDPLLPDLPEACQGFEIGSMPAGWTTSGSGTWSVGIGDYSNGTGSHTGTYNALITHGTSGNSTYLISPMMDLSSATSATFSFWYINRQWVNDIDALDVYYRVNGGGWQLLFNTTTAHGSWTEASITLPAGALAANFQIAFKYTDNYGYGVGIDDICIDAVMPVINEDCEGFDSESMPTGWTQSGTGSWTVGVGDYSTGTGSHTGSGNARRTHTNRGDENYLITPSMDFSSTSYVTLSFAYVNRSWGGDIDALTVYYRVNGGAWQQIFYTAEAHSTWTEVSINLPAGALAANCQIAFKYTDNYGYGVGIDDVCFTYPEPACTPRTASISGCPSSGEYLVMGNNLQLTGSTSAGGGTVTWSSSNTSVATVSNTGLVTPVAPGDVTITYSRAADDTYCYASTTCDITVRQCSAANTIILDDDKSKEIVCGQTYCFYDSGGPDGDYTTSEDYTATFTSMGEITITFTEFSSESCCDYITIYDGDDLTGNVLLNQHRGTSLPSPASYTATSGTMTVIWHSDVSNVSSGWAATLTAANCCSTPRTLTINGCPSSDMVSGSTATLSATVSPAGVGTVVWTSNNTTVADVSNTGVVTAKAPGSATITASIPRNGVWCNASATCTINVICAPNSATFALSTASGSLEEGQSIDLSELLTNGTGRTVSWTSSATGTATVNASGVVTGVAAGGPVTITARVAQWPEGGTTYCEKTATYTVNVTAINCTGGSWNIDDIDGQTKDIECGKIYCFYDSGGPDGDYENNSEDFSCAFSSSGYVHIKFIDFYTESPDRLTISGTDRDGTYYGTNIAPSSEFVCTTEGGTVNIGWTTDVSVLYRGWKAIITAEGCCETRENVAGFTFCRDDFYVAIGETLTMSVDGTDAVSPGGSVSYSSSNTSVATVDADGTVHGVAAGNAIITATMAATTVSGVDYCAVSTSYIVHVGTPGSGTGCFEIGDGTNTYYCPLPGWYGWQYDVYLYKPSDASELNNNINITSIAYYITNTSDLNGGQMQMWVKDVDADFSLAGANTFAELTSGATSVYTTNSLSTTTGWTTLNFSSPYFHEGGKTLLVAARGVGCTSGGGCTRYINHHTTASNMYWYYHADQTNDPGTSRSGSMSNSRANIKLCYNVNFTPDVMPELTLTGVPSTVVCSPAAISIDAAVSDGTVDAAALSAALPSGLTYSTSTHKITGSLTTGGTYEFDIIAKSDDGCLKDTKHVTITVNELNATIEFGD